MKIADLLLPELTNEIAVTRKVLERVPDDHAEWKPHEHSFPMAHLAQLVVRLPGWVPMILAKTELDIQPLDGPKFPGYSIEKVKTLLSELDKNGASARAAIAATSDSDFQIPWTLKKAGVVVMTQTRYQMLRSMALNHLVHHRAQLGLYLRLIGGKVPPMYGPTFDDR